MTEHTQNNMVYLTLYTVIGDFSRMKAAMIHLFSAETMVIEEDAEGQRGENGIEDRLVLRLKDGSRIFFSVRYAKEYIAQQIPGMVNYFSQAPLTNQELHRGVLNQISVFNCIASLQFEQTADNDRTNYIVGRVFAAAKEMNALVLYPSMELFTGEGKLLISMDGRSEYSNYTAVGNSDYLNGGKAEAEVDILRKERSFSILRSKAIPYIPHLQAAVREEEAVLRSIEEIAERIFAMFAICVYCEALSDEPRKDALIYVERMDELADRRLKQLMTPEEDAFMSIESPSAQRIADFGWKYECCHVLLWALGYIEELGYPDQICDVPALARILWNCGSLEQFKSAAKIRSGEEILDAADLVLRYNWAAVEARVGKKEPPAGLNGEVLYEWHYAFNWLVGANGGADWDDISPNT